MKKEKQENKVFLPANGAAATAPTPATTATPTVPAAFRMRFPKKFTKHN